MYGHLFLLGKRNSEVSTDYTASATSKVLMEDESAVYMEWGPDDGVFLGYSRITDLAFLLDSIAPDAVYRRRI